MATKAQQRTALQQELETLYKKYDELDREFSQTYSEIKERLDRLYSIHMSSSYQILHQIKDVSWKLGNL